MVGLISTGVGMLANGVKSLLSGDAKAKRKQAREDRKNAKSLAKTASMNVKTAQTTSEATMDNIKAAVLKYWPYAVGAIVLIFVLPKLIGMLKKKTVGGRRHRSRSVAKHSEHRTKKTRTTSKPKAGGGGFRKTIHGKVYTSKESWARAMMSLRKK